MTKTSEEQALLNVNQQMLESVVSGDWTTYSSFCREDLTCFEAESNGSLAEGLAFHKFYFTLPKSSSNTDSSSTHINVTMVRPHVRWLSEHAAILSYTRLTQRMVDGVPMTASCCETRVWDRSSGSWKQVHVHRS
ncbi:MAG: DUF4440 domain-containing protein [Cyanobacteriota bacterium]|jgi:ketosteroid isomerase-like protein